MDERRLAALFPDVTEEEVIRTCVARANANVQRMKSMRGKDIKDTDIVRKVIDGADLVIGVFKDDTQPYGVGRHVIKGQRLLMTIAAEQKDKSGRLECLALTCREEAVALQQAFGEPEPLN